MNKTNKITGFLCLSITCVSQKTNSYRIFLVYCNPNPLFLLYKKTQDQYKTITNADLLLLSSKKWYQKSRGLNTFVKVPQQFMPIGCVSAEVSNKVKLADNKGTISPSRRLTKETKGLYFDACFSPLF